MMRPKTRKRLLILLILGGVLGLGAGGVVVGRLQIIEHRSQAARAAGMAAFDKGDYDTALNKLIEYRRRHPEDMEAIYHLAIARLRLPLPDGSEIAAAAPLLRQVLQQSAALQPAERAEATHELLTIYTKAGSSIEGQKLAEQVLKADARDVVALQAETLALARLRKSKDALPYAERWVKAAPDDLEAQLAYLSIRLDLNAPPAELVAYARQLEKAHAGDARFELLLSNAYVLARDPKSALPWAQRAAAHPIADTYFVRVLINQLDHLGAYEDATNALAKIAVNSPGERTERNWMRRLWQVGHYQELADRLAKRDAASDDTPPMLAALRAMALARLEKKDDAEKIVAALDARGAKAALPKAWADVVRLAYLTHDADPQKLLDACQLAARLESDEPLLGAELAHAYALAGDDESAARLWRQLAQQNPGWALPLVEMAKAQASAGAVADAARFAQAAVQRAPHDRDAVTTLLALQSSDAALKDPARADALLKRIDAAQAEFPHEDQLALARTRVLLIAGRLPAAGKSVTAALERRPPLAEESFLAMARMCAQAKLPQVDAIVDACIKAHGETPSVDFFRALLLATQKRVPDALALYEAAQAKHPDDPLWQLGWARLLDAAQDKRAAATWAKLAASAPKNVRVQKAVLSAPSVQQDHALLGQALDRLEAVLGKQNLTLSLQRARWLLQGKPTDANVQEAISLLTTVTQAAPDAVAPRLLLADALERKGDASGATEQLAAAYESQPQAIELALQVAQRLRHAGDATRAKSYLDRAARSEHLTPTQLTQLGMEYAALGDEATATDYLQRGDSDNSARARLLLAQLYVRQDKLADAAALLQKLLADKPDAAALEFAVGYYAAHGTADQVHHVLELLDQSALSAGVRQAIRGDYLARTGKLDEARAAFVAATSAEPKNAALWRQLIRFELAQNHVKQALDVAQQAAAALPDDAGLKALLAQRDPLEKLAISPLRLTIARELLAGSTDAENLASAVQVMGQIQDKKLTPQQALDAVRPLAQKSPRSLSLQMLTIALTGDTGHMDDAITLATQAMAAFPNAPEPASIAAKLLAARGRWAEAAGAAQQWRRRAPEQARDAGEFIAAADLQTGQPDQALAQIQPYLAAAKQDPEHYRGLIFLAVEAYLQQGQAQTAADLVFPQLPRSAEWRNMALNMAARVIPDAPTAIQWIQKVQAAIPADAPAEQAVAAQAYRVFADRVKDPKIAQQGEAILKADAAKADAAPELLLAWGMWQEVDKDLSGAAATYERLLKKSPDSAIALNNLAMLQVKTRGNLQEGAKLIDKAIALTPNMATFYDTRARIYLAQKDYAQAGDSIVQAMRLEPDNPEWQLMQIEILAAAGQRAQAKSAFDRIRSQHPDGAGLADDLHPRYAELQKALGGPG